ncbi:MAG: type II secretion system protein GspN [Deltaproteobacteria bacterium]|nr:type II secretion system protein GspN [Deltaproteobacteria bacterium]
MIKKLRELDVKVLAATTFEVAKGLLFPVGFGTFVYLVSLVFIFPYGQIGNLIETMASNAGYDFEVDNIGPTLGIGVSMSDIKLKTRPTDGSKPQQFLVESARVTTNPLKNLMGGISYHVVAEAFGGDVDVDVEANAEIGHGSVDIEDVALAKLPGVAAAIGLPIKGNLSLLGDMELPELKIRSASGELEIGCSGCELGDNKAKLKVQGHPFLAAGVVIPNIRIGDLKGKIVFEDGVGRIDNLKSTGPDGELIVEGEVRLSSPAGMSRIDLYVRFKVSDGLLKRADAIALMLQVAEAEGKRPDGFYGFRLRGSLDRLGAPQWLKDAPVRTPATLPKRPRPVRTARPELPKT